MHTCQDLSSLLLFHLFQLYVFKSCPSFLFSIIWQFWWGKKLKCSQNVRTNQAFICFYISFLYGVGSHTVTHLWCSMPTLFHCLKITYKCTHTHTVLTFSHALLYSWMSSLCTAVVSHQRPHANNGFER